MSVWVCVTTDTQTMQTEWTQIRINLQLLTVQKKKNYTIHYLRNRLFK